MTPRSSLVLRRPQARRVLSIPAHHPYLTAVRPSTVEPVRPERTRGWEADPFFSPTHVTSWADEIDLVHLHFGFDHLAPHDAREWVGALASTRTPLVLTVHDLRNPHHDDRRRHDDLLEVLVPAADAVLTLTRGAAREIAQRFGRLALVVPHPTLLAVEPPASPTEPGLVLLHLKSLRRNVADPLAVVAAAAAGAAGAGGRLRVDVHPEVLDDVRVTGLSGIVAAGGGELVVHQRFDDDELQAYLARGQVTVLPHRWGTHSGWLELARDLGTRVVAPSCGFYREQWDDVVPYTHDEVNGLDVRSLGAAVHTALTRPGPGPVDRMTRLREVVAGRQAHAEVYARVAPVRRRPRWRV